MEALKEIQQILDGCLLSRGILSHHMRRRPVNEIAGGGKACDDKYVVYRIVTQRGRVYGDGKRLLSRVSFDVNFYYKDTSKNSDAVAAAAIVKEIEAAFVAANWFIVNGQTDLYDIDNAQKGINIEVARNGV